MSSEEYYGDNKFPIRDNGSHSPMPPYSHYPPSAATPSAGGGSEGGYQPYPGQGANQYQQPNQYYGGYQQQPPPSYYQQQQQPPYQQGQYRSYPNLYQNQYPSHYQNAPQYPPQYQPQPGYPQDAPPEFQAQAQQFLPSTSTDNDRGALGALAGGAAGAYAGHQVHHGVLGTIGGAIAGSLAQDAIKQHNKPEKEKKEKKEKKSRFGFHRRDSSSSSSSDSDHEDKKKPKPAAVPAQPKLRGNFSATSSGIALHGNHELVAHCSAVNGHRRESRLPLSSVLTNEFGHFKWKRNGNFGASAKNARLIEGGRVLEAELANGNGGWRRDWVRLDERIENRDGVLVFLD
ncbi:CVNH domain-containing protein [Aspergillus karnatakaensis]|uniref:putative glutamine-serine-proline rich protein n=1 Tax=Aspergillus karnatakaensis TaxID=1810916 RepID=UPI003CCE2BE7